MARKRGKPAISAATQMTSISSQKPLQTKLQIQERELGKRFRVNTLLEKADNFGLDFLICSLGFSFFPNQGFTSFGYLISKIWLYRLIVSVRRFSRVVKKSFRHFYGIWI
ncbi:hypothetical protein ACLB2K_008114 [Fragaria x ananassa]